jgi:hypothetical protein
LKAILLLDPVARDNESTNAQRFINFNVKL